MQGIVSSHQIRVQMKQRSWALHLNSDTLPKQKQACESLLRRWRRYQGVDLHFICETQTHLLTSIPTVPLEPH